jgi:hypothetical protein
MNDLDNPVQAVAEFRAQLSLYLPIMARFQWQFLHSSFNGLEVIFGALYALQYINFGLLRMSTMDLIISIKSSCGVDLPISALSGNLREPRWRGDQAPITSNDVHYRCYSLQPSI